MSTITYDHHCSAERGPRPSQADAAGHHSGPRGRQAWAIADGVGNHPHAPAAARLAVDTATARAAATGDAVLGIHGARDALHATHEQGFRGDSTLVVAVATAEGIDLAWVGDSRAYALYGDTVTALTVDHNEGTRLRHLGHQVPDASRFFHCLTSHVRDGEIGHVYLDNPVERLLLCTDGVYRVLEPGGLLAEAAIRFRRNPAALADRLMLAIRKRGPVDNATALVIQRQPCV